MVMEIIPHNASLSIFSLNNSRTTSRRGFHTPSVVEQMSLDVFKNLG
jgi:hypothetical protein